MNTTKYELYGFSCLVGVAVVLLLLPGSEDDRKALKDTGRSVITQTVFSAR